MTDDNIPHQIYLDAEPAAPVRASRALALQDAVDRGYGYWRHNPLGDAAVVMTEQRAKLFLALGKMVGEFDEPVPVQNTTCKLIRDRLPSQPVDWATETVSHPLHLCLLGAKMHEEADEIVRAGFADPLEFADLLQVLKDTAQVAGHDWDRIEELRVAKEKIRGGFLAGNLMVRQVR